MYACVLELRARVEALEAHAGSLEVTAPAPVAGGLVERVAAAIHPDRCADPNLYLHEARAAILEVARWLRSELVSRNVAERLERETGRWP